LNNIKILRVEKNLSQGELAKQVNVSQTAVSQWEIGKTNPDKNSTNLLADFFGVSVDYLLGRTDERTSTYYASNIHGSTFVQSNGSVNISGDVVTSKEEAEILRVYRSLDVRGRSKLMRAIFDLEDEAKNQREAGQE